MSIFSFYSEVFKRPFDSDLGRTGGTAWSLLMFFGMELLDSVELYSGDCLEMAGGADGETEWPLLRSSGTEFLTLVELYLGDGIKMAGHVAMTLGGRRLHAYCFCLPGL